MDKRYQVFVSSTFADLKSERRAVMQAVMELDCIPAGMELFPAADDEQMKFIQKVIDDCDYYLLLIGGRYGSLHRTGRSFTELEFDYATERGIPVLAFLHEDPNSLRDSGESEDQFTKLLEFRERVTSNRVVKLWSNPAELAGTVALSLARALKTYPAVGWIRANQAPTTELLQELNEVRKQKEAIEQELTRLKAELVPTLPDLASLDAEIEIEGSSKSTARDPYLKAFKVRMSFREIFAAIAPYIANGPNETSAFLHIRNAITAKAGRRSHSVIRIDDQVFQTLKLQLIALNLLTVDYLKTVSGGMAWFWRLTASGRKAMFEMRTFRVPGEGEAI